MSNVPVVLVHGWGGSYQDTWVGPGWTALLQDIGISAIGVDLLGHGTAPKPHDPAAYSDLSDRILAVLPDGPVDAVGFSLGAMTLLRLAVDQPGRFRRLVLMGIGEGIFRDDAARTAALVAAVEGNGPLDDVGSQVFAQYANAGGNDPIALAAIFKRTRSPFVPADLQRVACPTLVVIGDRDQAGPGEPLAEALPHGKLVTIRRCDHFATTENFNAIDAVLDFLGSPNA